MVNLFFKEENSHFHMNTNQTLRRLYLLCKEAESKHKYERKEVKTSS